MNWIPANSKIVVSIILIVFFPSFMIVSVPRTVVWAQTGPNPFFDLERTVRDAVSANLGLESAREEILASEADVKAKKSEFLPVLNLGYEYVRNDDDQSASGIGTIGTENEYSLSATLSQPVFRGFKNRNLLKISQMGMESARLNEEVVLQNIVFQAKDAYFSLLKARKIREISAETVAQIEAQRDVAQQYYDVGMTPRNDYLQAEVELANAKQSLTIAKNEMETAEAAFNTLLRRPINAPVQLADITTYAPFLNDIEYCLGEAEKHRREIQIAAFELEIAERELEVAKSTYYPTVDFQWNYLQQGEDWDARGGLGAFGDSSSWNIAAVASWDVFDWGRTYYSAQEQVHRVSQARLQRMKLLDDIRLEVKKSYLAMRDLEENIKTVELAIEQAKENYRIFTERYKEQVATQTDVLIAQTLLSRTQTNYYNALYDYKRAKAALLRAMGSGGLAEDAGR